MKKNTKKVLAGLTLAASPLSVNPAADEFVLGEYTLSAAEAHRAEYTKLANVQGSFRFTQDVLSPSEDVFNLYGTAVTGMCAKPAFAFEAGEEDVGRHYINVSGSMKHDYSVTVNDLRAHTRTRVAACSCATGKAVTQVQISGVPVSSILSLAELQEGVNTLTVTASDGYKVSMPLRYALDREAMIVYQVNGDELAMNQRTQFWVPGAVAKYFARDVVDIEVTCQAETPEIIEADAEQAAKVSIMNDAKDAVFNLGESIQFEGYADDCRSAVAAVEFSMDGGETWTVCETPNATTDRWVYWYFTIAPEAAGEYELTVRARTEDGTVSPLASSMRFAVTEG